MTTAAAFSVPITAPPPTCYECKDPLAGKPAMCWHCHQAELTDAENEQIGECQAELRTSRDKLIRAASEWARAKAALGQLDRATADALLGCLGDLDEYLGD